MSAAPPPGPPSDLRHALPETGRLVAGVGDDQWALPSPCDGWTVRDVVQHLVDGNRQFASALGAEVASDEGDTPDDGWPAAYVAAADLLAAAADDPQVLGRMVTVPVGTVPGAVAIQLRLVEQLVHAWDVAQATGQVPAFEQAVVERAHRFSEQALAQLPPERSPFGPPREAPADATPLDRLAALLGRG